METTYHCVEAGLENLAVKGIGRISLVQTHNLPVVSINGYTLKANTPQSYFCPSTHSALNLTIISSNSNIEHINNTSIDQTTQHYEKIYKKITHCDIVAIFKLEQVPETVRSLQCIKLYPKIYKEPTPKISSRSGISTVGFGAAEERFIEDRVNEKSRIVCVGPANSGKSTFNRYLLNRLLGRFKSVLYMDLDPGQTEFTPPTLLSLVKVTQPILGPPYTHKFAELEIQKLGFVGDISPGDNPHNYLHIVESLVDHLEKFSHSENCPLVVNYMGWMEGLGLKLLGDACRMINSTDIVQLDAIGKRGVRCETLDADYLYDNTIYYKNQFGELLEPLTTPEFLLISRCRDDSIEQAKSNNFQIPAWQHREMMIDMQISAMLTKRVDISMKRLCITVTSEPVPEHLYPACIDQQIIGIFAGKPKIRNKCITLPASRSSSPELNNNINKFGALAQDLSSSSSETSASESISQFETSKRYPPLEVNCLGIAFVNRIQDGVVSMLFSDSIDPEHIEYLVKGSPKGLNLNPDQLKRLTGGESEFVESFERDNVIKGADFFVKTKRVFK